MGYSGLIYAAIVAGWAAVLVPRWVRRNEEVERAREVDEARGVRVLQRRSRAIHATHQTVPLPPERTVLHGGARGLTVGAARRPVETAVRPRPSEELDFSAAARRRRRALAMLLVITIVVAVAVTRAMVPSWLVVGPATMLVGFLVAARRAAVTEAGRRREFARRRDVDRARVKADVIDDDRPRVAVLDEADLVAEAVDPDAWEPVPVPRPSYLSKAMAPPRVARAIDLSQPGSWTSGRLDPVGSITLPPAHPAADELPAAAESDDDYEQRRAVGD